MMGVLASCATRYSNELPPAVERAPASVAYPSPPSPAPEPEPNEPWPAQLEPPLDKPVGNAGAGAVGSANARSRRTRQARTWMAARPPRGTRRTARIPTGVVSSLPSGISEQQNVSPTRELQPPPVLNPANQTPTPGLPVYSQWPPEEASSRVSLDFLIEDRSALSLYEVGQRLRSALREAEYGQHSFYAVPGGFILLTDREQIDPEGQAYSDLRRYQMPGEGRDSWWQIIRDLFLERPESYYRYMAIVVSDQPFSAVGEELTPEEAVNRLQRGNTDLTRDTKQMPFSDDHRVTALIYEFVNGGADKKLDMISPGRLNPSVHLRASGLTDTVPRQFARRARNSGLGAE